MLLQENHRSARSDGPRSGFRTDLLAEWIIGWGPIEQESGVMVQGFVKMDDVGLRRRLHNPLHRRSRRVAAVSRVCSPLERSEQWARGVL